MGKNIGKKTKEIKIFKRGEIYLVEFDPARGREIKKTRPALVVQNNVGNKYSTVTIVAAMTSSISINPYPIEVIVLPEDSGLAIPSTVRLDHKSAA